MGKKRCGSRGASSAERKRRIRSLQASGLSPSAFSRREGIARSTLYRWQREVEGGRVGHAGGPRPSFAEVRVEEAGPEAASPPPSPFGVAIVLSSGDRLLLSEACDPRWLGRVVRALRSGPC